MFIRLGIFGCESDCFHSFYLFIILLIVMYKVEAEALDVLLMAFSKTPMPYCDIREQLPDCDEAIGRLLADGMLQQNKYGVYVTEKGRVHLHKGGYRRLRRKAIINEVAFWISLVASVVTILSVVFALVI